MVSSGELPTDWKSMSDVGPGTYELRIHPSDVGENRTFRVLYVAKFAEAVYVLHAFEKKTRSTSKHDLDIGRSRYRQMLLNRKSSPPRSEGT